MAVVERAGGVKRCRVINGEIFFSNKAGSRVCLAHIDTRNGEDSSSNESVGGKGDKNRLQRKREKTKLNLIEM